MPIQYRGLALFHAESQNLHMVLEIRACVYLYAMLCFFNDYFSVDELMRVILMLPRLKYSQIGPMFFFLQLSGKA